MPDAPQDPLDTAGAPAPDATAGVGDGAAAGDGAGAGGDVREADDQVLAEALTPLDVDGVRAIEVGTVLWTVALVVCLLAREQLAAAGTSWWTWVCLTGALLGLPGMWYVRRRARAYARG